jgi:Family of unknown function (DUF6134)
VRIVPAVLLLLCLGGRTFAVPTAETFKYVIMRDGKQIGTSTTNIQQSGSDTLVDTTTSVGVKILGFTVYRYEQKSNEHWADGHLVALRAQTNDNGTERSMSVTLHDKKLVGEADGKKLSLDADLIPSSVWTPKLVSQTVVIDTADGKLMRISVADLGTESISVRGQTIKARHYAMDGRLKQDLWYDERDRLVQLRFKGSDGSVISYRLM